jgi:hypothetical protein
VHSKSHDFYSIFPYTGRENAGRDIKELRKAGRVPWFLSSPPASVKLRTLFTPPTLQCIWGSALNLDICCPKGQKLGVYGTSGNLPGSQTIKIPEASSHSPYSKRSFYSESSIKAENQLFYRRLQLVFLTLRAQCPQHVGECLATEPYPVQW